MKPREIIFEGVDFWGRPVFKDQNGFRFGSTERLVNSEKELNDITEKDLCYFGTTFDEHDPLGITIDHNKIKIVKQFNDEQN